MSNLYLSSQPRARIKNSFETSLVSPVKQNIIVKVKCFFHEATKWSSRGCANVVTPTCVTSSTTTVVIVGKCSPCVNASFTEPSALHRRLYQSKQSMRHTCAVFVTGGFGFSFTVRDKTTRAPFGLSLLISRRGSRCVYVIY